jgi:hypothetical protein
MSGGDPLFGRLEEEHVPPRELVRACSQDLRDAEEHRRVRVVSARVHDARHLGAKRQLHRLLDG